MDLSLLTVAMLSQWLPWDRHGLCCSWDKKRQFTILALLDVEQARAYKFLHWWHLSILTDHCKYIKFLSDEGERFFFVDDMLF